MEQCPFWAEMETAYVHIFFYRNLATCFTTKFMLGLLSLHITLNFICLCLFLLNFVTAWRLNGKIAGLNGVIRINIARNGSNFCLSTIFDRYSSWFDFFIFLKSFQIMTKPIRQILPYLNLTTLNSPANSY